MAFLLPCHCPRRVLTVSLPYTAVSLSNLAVSLPSRQAGHFRLPLPSILHAAHLFSCRVQQSFSARAAAGLHPHGRSFVLNNAHLRPPIPPELVFRVRVRACVPRDRSHYFLYCAHGFLHHAHLAAIRHVRSFRPHTRKTHTRDTHTRTQTPTHPRSPHTCTHAHARNTHRSFIRMRGRLQISMPGPHGIAPSTPPHLTPPHLTPPRLAPRHATPHLTPPCRATPHRHDTPCCATRRHTATTRRATPHTWATLFFAVAVSTLTVLAALSALAVLSVLSLYLLCMLY